MATYDANTAECLVYSFKDGLLSTIAHDLKHRVTRFVISVDEKLGMIDAAIDARSLRVECVMKDGMEADGGLSSVDRRRIEKQIVRDVLNADAQPLIRFCSTTVSRCPEGLHIQGMLKLNNFAHHVSTVARRVNGHYEAEMSIHQPTFGIKPFSAMMGTLKVKPEVLVRVVIPAA